MILYHTYVTIIVEDTIIFKGENHDYWNSKRSKKQ